MVCGVSVVSRVDRVTKHSGFRRVHIIVVEPHENESLARDKYESSGEVISGEDKVAFIRPGMTRRK